jgi:hypothetical protein
MALRFVQFELKRALRLLEKFIWPMDLLWSTSAALEGIRLRSLVITCDNSRLWMAFSSELSVDHGSERQRTRHLLNAYSTFNDLS